MSLTSKTATRYACIFTFYRHCSNILPFTSIHSVCVCAYLLPVLLQSVSLCGAMLFLFFLWKYILNRNHIHFTCTLHDNNNEIVVCLNCSNTHTHADRERERAYGMTQMLKQFTVIYWSDSQYRSLCRFPFFICKVGLSAYRSIVRPSFRFVSRPFATRCQILGECQPPGLCMMTKDLLTYY